MLPLEEARRRKPPLVWRSEEVAIPERIGVHILDNYPLEELVPYIDWTPFFHTWELHGRYPAIFEDAIVGETARKTFEDAQALLERIVCEKRLTARGIYGLFPANSVGDDVEIYTDETRETTLTGFHFLRQQMDKQSVGGVKSKDEERDSVNYCLADFVAPRATGIRDYIGGFAVTTGHGIDELTAEFRKENDDYSAIMAEALADRLAEAFAERLHKIVRDEWGYGRAEQLSHEELIRERYRGIRPAAGYPACPDHTEKRELFDLLCVEQHTGITLTESFAMHPGSAVSGLYFAHPQSRYFPVGKIERDQVQDYARRKGESVEYIEKWLAPNLNFDPN